MNSHYLNQRKIVILVLWFSSCLQPATADQTADLINRGFQYYQAKDYTNAWKCFDLACKNNPQSAEAYDARGVAEINLNNFVAAKADFDKALLLEPNYASAYMDRGMMYFQQKKNADAIQDFNRAIALVPSNPDNFRRRAEAYKNMHHYSEAIADCNRALALKPDFAFIYCLRANLYYLTHEFEKALLDATKSIDLGFDAPFVRGQRGWDYYQLEQDEKAIIDFQKAIAMDPGCENAHEGLGQIYADRKEFDKALAEFGKALSRSPDWSEGYYRRGLCYYRMGKYIDALRDFDLAVKADPADPAGYIFRGDLYQALEEYDKAKADYKQAIAREYDPTYRGTNILRHAYLCMQLSQYKDVITDCNLLTTSSTKYRKDKIAAELYRANARICLGQYKEALEEISQILKQERDYLREEELQYAVDSFDECNYVLDAVKRAAHSKLLERGESGEYSDNLPPGTLERWSLIFPNKLVTKHFVFISALPKEHLLSYGQFCEAYWTLINREFFTLKETQPTLVCILPSRKKLKDFIRTQISPKVANALGLYTQGLNFIVLCAGTGIGITSHEIMHKALTENQFSLEPWAVEAIPTFFEKFYAYFEGDVLNAKFGYQHSERVRWIGPKLTKLKLSEIISNQSPADFENEERLVSMFLFDSGKLKDFIESTRTNKPLKYKTRIESVFDMPMEQLEKLWSAYLQKVERAKPNFSRLPPTKYFADKTTYEKFMSQNETTFVKAKIPKASEPTERSSLDPVNAIRTKYLLPSNAKRDMGD